MKNSSSVKAKNNTESPKTPGGISKSLLTPCRRVGLSRNWRKSGPSPFISPLCSTNISNRTEDIETKPNKRKKRSPEKEIEDSGNKDDNNMNSKALQSTQITEATSTPKRSVLQRKKSKTTHLQLVEENVDNKISVINNRSDGEEIELPPIVSVKREKCVSTLSRKSSKNITNSQSLDISENSLDKKDVLIAENKITNPTVETTDTKQISPNNLSKECIVIIQNKINSAILNNQNNIKSARNTTSQVLFDSDSDDVPLCQLNKEINDKAQVAIGNLEDKNTSTRNLDCVSKPKQKLSTKKHKNPNCVEGKPIFQTLNSFDDNEDDEFDTRKTILIKKTYKIIKPVKAKSTGSITDQDIDELKARIEAKKQLLLAKALTPETEELRSLIKRWQKGCQDALMELMDMMKKRMPDQNVENSEILRMLKIPSNLVGYDSDNDCFNTPTDENVILASLNV